MMYPPDPKDPRGLLLPWKLYGGIPTIRVTPDDFLVVAVRNALAGVTLQLGGRLWHDDGSPNEYSHPIVPGSARALQYFGFQLEHGFLATAVVTATGGAPHRGQTLASIYLVRPPLSGFGAKQLLAQDYITTQYGPAWPGGRVILGIEGPGTLYSLLTNPSTGADWSFVVPTGARWLVHSIRGTLSTTATAGARQPRLQFLDSIGAIVGEETSGLTQAPSLANIWDWLPGYPSTGFLQLSNNMHALPFPMYLGAGWQVITLTANLAVGDQWSAVRLQVEEWLED